MSWIILGLGLVLLIEGLVYALAPSLVENLLVVMRDLSLEARRLIGLVALTAGAALVLFAVWLGV